MRISNFAVLAVVSLALSGCGRSHPGSREGRITGRHSDPPVTLEVKWASSNRYLFRAELTSSSDLVRPAPLKPVLQETSLGHDYSVTVTRTLPDGGHALALEFRTLQFEASIEDKTSVSYDSENRVIGTFGDPTAEILQRLIGGRLRFQLSPSNTVIRFEGVRELNDRVLGGNARGQAVSIFRRHFTTPYFKELVEIDALPLEPIRVGDSWPVQRELSYGQTGNTMRVDLTCTFKGWQEHAGRKCALIEFTGAIVPGKPADGKPRLMAPPEVHGTLNGRIWFDPGAASVAETVSDQTLTYPGTGRRPRGADTNAPPPKVMTTQRQHMSIKLLEVVPVDQPAGDSAAPAPK